MQFALEHTKICKNEHYVLKNTYNMLQNINLVSSPNQKTNSKIEGPYEVQVTTKINRIECNEVVEENTNKYLGDKVNENNITTYCCGFISSEGETFLKHVRECEKK